ncbi:PDZ 2 and/or GRASP55 65 domain containing protein [Asbolus verrucosus]|uniref:PDZ 2 and/or GRASP55 65 domain containing protein n=1 Tax=Asbolus verrucosus TaxID=1661398 RepID=A0A482VRQ3_ASBVE|nr:PDZ 2 and/or GRASP55 65 domain containing protein [Asbolus verrucosus]
MMKQKDKIEDEIKQLTQILTMNGVGMNDPLVDTEGFPINSIDVYQVRHARHGIICLQNDHKAIMKQIENGLQGYYSSAGAQVNVQDIEMKSEPASRPVAHETPFAKVTLVTPGSPAEFAGLREGDGIVEFGSVNFTNFKNITDIAFVVQHSEGAPVNLKLKRVERFVTAQLVPRRWQGKGLLGCNIEAL